MWRQVAKLAGAFVVSNAAFVVAKYHVHDPAQGVFDGLVRADRRADHVGRHHRRCDVEARLVGDFAVDFTPAFDLDNGVQARPLVARLQPVDIVDHGVVSRLGTAVISVDRFMRADRGILAWFSAHRRRHRHLAQGCLITPQRDNVIGRFLDNFRGEVALAARRIDRHERALD
jgi:hypothetical protein